MTGGLINVTVYRLAGTEKSKDPGQAMYADGALSFRSRKKRTKMRREKNKALVRRRRMDVPEEKGARFGKK